jgi:glycosyltransferase involved in cell wall biosynthesis
MDSLPLVSVGIPTYNRPEGLEKTLTQLRAQTYSNIEIIVSDNHSPSKRVQEIALACKALDTRIQFFRQEKNIEAEPNFNFVFHRAKGKYFMWMSDDDDFDTNYISVLVDFLEHHPDYVHAVGIALYERNGEILLQEANDSVEGNTPTKRVIQYINDVRKNGLFYGLFRRNLPINTPFQNRVGTDWCLIATLAWYGKLKRVPTTTYRRSLDGGSASRERMTNRWKMHGLKKLLFESYVAYQVSTGIFTDSLKHEGSFFLKTYIFIRLHFKFIWNSVRKRCDPTYV